MVTSPIFVPNPKVMINSIIIAFILLVSNPITVKTSIYNPVPSQCWGDGTLTRSGSRINKSDLRKERIRWISISRNLHVKYGGNLKFNDTIIVLGKSYYAGKWIVKDWMNKRYKNRVDFLQSKFNKRIPPKKIKFITIKRKPQ